MPYLDVPWIPGALDNWNKQAPLYRGRGRGFNSKKKSLNTEEHNKGVFYRRLDAPPDFVFFANTKRNEKMMRELNSNRIPMAAMCDSDIKTQFLQYVIPCNTSSIQSVHFVFDMLTRGVLEAQHRMERDSWKDKWVKRDQKEEEAEKLSK